MVKGSPHSIGTVALVRPEIASVDKLFHHGATHYAGGELDDVAHWKVPGAAISLKWCVGRETQGLRN